MKKLLFLSTALVLLAFVLAGCHTTASKTGSLKGIVMLVNDTGDTALDPSDFSGVTVALYKPAILDTTLVRLNAEYPQTGVPISQETEFDHRSAQPIKTTISDASGAFSFKGVESGKYILALLKEQWGVRYVYSVDIADGDTDDIGSIEMYPAVEFGSSVINNITLKSDHTYLIPGDINFVGSVTIEPRARIYCSPGSIIQFFGSVLTPEYTVMTNAWKLMSAKGMYSTEVTVFGAADNIASMQLHGDQLELRSGVIQHINNSIVLNGSSCTVTDMLISYCSSAFYIPQSNASVSNVTIAHGFGVEASDGVNIQAGPSNTVQISECVFMNIYQAMLINSQGSFNISECYFYGASAAITLSNCTGTITHNAFEHNFFDIMQGPMSAPTEISYNNFYVSDYRSIYPRGGAVISNNNFFRTDEYFIWIRNENLPNNCAVAQNLSAINNYWALQDVDQYLLDATDNNDYPTAPCLYSIIYNPRRWSVISDAGIQ